MNYDSICFSFMCRGTSIVMDTSSIFLQRKIFKKKRRPVVTIGICVRNAEATIKEAINSVLIQDFPHEFMEVIFVDDGSEDKTLSIINSYVANMDMNLKVFSYEWKGLGSARNVVVDNAEGEYIIWVDGDMILPKDHVRKQVRFMEENGAVGIAKARYEDHAGENLVEMLENAAFLAMDYIHGGKATSRPLGTGGSVYRVEAIRKVGGFDDNIRGVGEDMDAEYKVRNAGWLTYMGAPARFYERRRKTWKALWNEGFWHGYGGHFIFASARARKDNNTIAFYKLTPPAVFLAGVWYSTAAYKVMHKKMVFFLPLQYAFKRLAWLFGFIKGQIDERKQDS